MEPNTLIDTNEALSSLIVRAQQSDAIALDTEFVWERTYYPRLGLVQLALSNEECFLIDPLAIDDLHPLGELLADENVIKIFHDAPQDLAILARETQSIPKNIFDTRLAAGFAELPATLSLVNLVQQLLDIPIDKSATRTNWLQRPLTTTQLLYAEDDVRYLRALRIVLLSRIVAPEQKEWLKEELSLLNNSESYDIFNIARRYKKIRGQQHLDAESLSILKKLSVWREEIAQKKDRPRGHILQDAVLIEIAQKKPQDLAALHNNTAISAKAGKQYGAALLTLIAQAEHEERGESNDDIQSKKKKLTAAEKAVLSSLNKYILLKSDLLGLDPSLIGNNSELRTLARLAAATKRQPDARNRQCQGWRKKFLADFFEED